MVKPRKAEFQTEELGPVIANAIEKHDSLEKPSWDADSGDLWFGGRILKEIRRPAPWIRLVLTAFEEEGWTRHIFSPLPGRAGTSSTNRLHNVVTELNARHKFRAIRFRLDGTGQGIIWERLNPLPE